MNALQRHTEPGYVPVHTGALPALDLPYHYRESEIPRHIDPGPEMDHQAYAYTNNTTIRDAPLAEGEQLFAHSQFEFVKATVQPDTTLTSTYDSQWVWDVSTFPSHNVFQDEFVFRSGSNPMYYPAPLDFSIAHEEEAEPLYPGYLQSDVETSGTNTSMPVGSSQMSINGLPPEVDVPAVHEASLSVMSTPGSEGPRQSSDPRGTCDPHQPAPVHDTPNGKRSRGRKRPAAGQYDLHPFEQVLDLGIDPLIMGDDTTRTAGEMSKAGVVKRTRKEKGPRKSCACDLCHALKLRCLTAPGELACGTCIKTNLDLPADKQVVCESTRIPRRKGRRPNSVKAAMRMMGLIV